MNLIKSLLPIRRRRRALPKFETLGGAAAREVQSDFGDDRDDSCRIRKLSEDNIRIMQAAYDDEEEEEETLKSKTFSSDAVAVAVRVSVAESSLGSSFDEADSNVDTVKTRSSRSSSRSLSSLCCLPSRRLRSPPSSARRLEGAHQRINIGRRVCGQPKLSRDASLDELAKSHAKQLASVSGALDFPSDFDSAVDDRFVRIGINVCRGTIGAAALHQRMMVNSASDRANLLDPHFTDMGVGVATSPDGMTYLCQVFGE